MIYIIKSALNNQQMKFQIMNYLVIYFFILIKIIKIFLIFNLDDQYLDYCLNNNNNENDE